MSVVVVTACPQCQAIMHRSWAACAVCKVPASPVIPQEPIVREKPVPPSPPSWMVVTTHGRYGQPVKRDLVHLDPILPACPVCGEMQYWHNHRTDVWECWGCVPPSFVAVAGS